MADITAVVAGAVGNLITLLRKVKAARDQNNRVASEIDLFVRSLNENVAMMNQMLEAIPNTSKRWTLQGLDADLKKATNYLEDGLQKGFFQSILDTKKVLMELESLRRNLSNSFQLKVFITALEVVVEGDKKMENFQARMWELSKVSAAIPDSEETKGQIRELLGPVMMRMQRQDEKLDTFIAMFRGLDDTVESSQETQKFLQDVLWNLEYLPRDSEAWRHSEASVNGRSIPSAPPLGDPENNEEFLDPITFELMCDPVKCNDGVTYDRWTVIQSNESSSQSQSQSRPLQILCDDVNMRRRLFETVPESQGLQEKYRARRQEYRAEALRLAKDGRSGEALKRLKNVLLWDEFDPECRQKCQLMEMALSMNPVRGIPVTGTPVMLPPPQFGAFQESMNTGVNGIHKEFQNSYHEDPVGLTCRICIGVCCFPWSVCCIICLCPELFKYN